MKKLLNLCVMILLCGMTIIAMAQNSPKVERSGNTFTEIKTTKSSDVILTDYYYNTGDKTYQIFINKASGRCFINKVSSKTGKTYRYYLPEVICREICREMQIVYVDKK